MSTSDRLKLSTTSVYLQKQGEAGVAVWATLLAKAIKIDPKEMIEARGGETQFINPHDARNDIQDIFPFSTVCFKTVLPDMTVYCIQTHEADLFYTAGGALPTCAEDYSDVLHETAQDDGLGRLILPANSAFSKNEFGYEGTPVLVAPDLEMIPGNNLRFRLMCDGQAVAGVQIEDNEVSRTYVALAHRDRGLERLIEHKVAGYIEAQLKEGKLKRDSPLNFSALYDPRITDHTDLTHFLGGFDGAAFGSLNGLMVLRALQRIDTKNPEKARLCALELPFIIQHFAVGALLFRGRELENPEISERSLIDAAITLMRAVYSKLPGELRARTPLVAAGMLAFLEFKKSKNIDYFADQIIGRSGNNKSLACILLSHADIKPGLGENLKVDLHPLYATLRQAIKRQIDLKSWILKNIPADARLRAHANTGFEEIIETMPRADRGKALEDVLGL
jgi:hypothetical protein